MLLACGYIPKVRACRRHEWPDSSSTHLYQRRVAHGSWHVFGDLGSPCAHLFRPTAGKPL